MFEKKAVAKGSAFDLAQSIPADAQVALGFHLKGQLDVLGMVSDLSAVASQAGDQFSFDGLQKELGLTLEQWLSMFSGRGYFAVLQPKPGTDWTESLVLALQLEKPDAFAKWLTPKLGKPVEDRQVGGYRVREIADGTRFGVGKGWFFIVATDSAADRLAGALSGKAPVLANTALFQRAQDSLKGGASGMFGFAEGEGIRQTIYSTLEVSADEMGTQELAFWDFGVFSLDFAQEQADAFVGFNPKAAESLLGALRQPGQVRAELLDLLPPGLTTVMAGDARWFANSIDSLANEVPALGFMVAMAYTGLSEYGDFGEAFGGTLTVGTNLPEYVGQSLRQELYTSRQFSELVQCQSNLKIIGTACEMWSIDNGGTYPEAIDVLAGDYLHELPICPTEGAKPYKYQLFTVDSKTESGEETQYPVYLVSCGGTHEGVTTEHPKYSGEVGLIEGYDNGVEPDDPNRPIADPGFKEPSFVVALPVKSVEETHKLMVSAVKSNRRLPSTECGENLTTIATACDMYSTDNEGAYPKTLAELVEIGYYLPEVPLCPAAGKDTYSETYKVARSGDDDTGLMISLHCQGHHHDDLEADKPSYDSGEGLVMGPVTETVATTPQPTRGEKQSYEVQDGPRAVLDADAKLLRLAYGPKAESLLRAPAGKWSTRPPIAETLRWGQDSIIYLDYLDLEPMYASLMTSLAQAAGEGEEEAAFLSALFDQFRPRLGRLEGASCLKVTEQGFHYRSKGSASTGQFLAGAVLGTAVFMPNFARARGQGELTACKSNLKNIGTALEMWAIDNEGKFPESLGQLTPEYLREIPACPAAGLDTYSAAYTVTPREGNDLNDYEVSCGGHHHADVGLEEGYPRYNSEQGLIE
jgi:hypothetical protein